jgi:hypothetical protein
MMLRTFVLALSIVMMAIGAWPCVSGAHLLCPVLIWGVVLFLGTVFERWRYRSNASHLDDGWAATDERFVDPESGKLMQVYYQASTGERRYEAVDH